MGSAQSYKICELSLCKALQPPVIGNSQPQFPELPEPFLIHSYCTSVYAAITIALTEIHKNKQTDCKSKL